MVDWVVRKGGLLRWCGILVLILLGGWWLGVGAPIFLSPVTIGV